MDPPPPLRPPLSWEHVLTISLSGDIVTISMLLTTMHPDGDSHPVWSDDDGYLLERDGPVGPQGRILCQCNNTMAVYFILAHSSFHP